MKRNPDQRTDAQGCKNPLTSCMALGKDFCLTRHLISSQQQKVENNILNISGLK